MGYHCGEGGYGGVHFLNGKGLHHVSDVPAI